MTIKVNDMDLRAMSLFTKGFDKELYIREAGKMLKVSSRTALVTLAKLEKQGILESKTRGKIKTYALTKSGLTKEFLILAEQYKKIQFLQNHLIIKEVLEQAAGFLPGIAVIFGSYAKGTNKAGSDLDLFIAGKADENKLRDIGRKYGIEISIKAYPMAIFTKDIHEDILLKEIVESHILVKGTEDFVREAMHWTK